MSPLYALASLYLFPHTDNYGCGKKGTPHASNGNTLICEQIYMFHGQTADE